MRRLARGGEPALGIEPSIMAVLDQRLRPRSARPVAVALSGGGDSVALLLAATAWASRRRRRLIVLTVDHGVRPQSADWTLSCAARCHGLGLDFQALKWLGQKPASGLPARARDARHRLLAEAARTAGARVILMGHTADDLLEAQAMRADGATTPSAREWAPSPVWPEGRGVFLLRPMLALRRAEIRTWLNVRGERWIEDPANDDLQYARARARRGLDPEGLAEAEVVSLPPIIDLVRACRDDWAGVLALRREVLREASSVAAARFISMASLCAAGTERPAAKARARARRLADRIRGAENFAATLAGARVEADAQEVRLLREVGEMARGGLAPLRLETGAGVWDGRFEIEADQPVEIRPLQGRMASLPPGDRARLSTLTAKARPTLPQVMDDDGAPVSGVRIAALALARLQAAAGLIEAEPA